MLLAASEALAKQVTDDNYKKGLLFPPFSDIRKISANIAANVAAKAYELGLATHLPRPENLVKYAERCMYTHVYRNYRKSESPIPRSRPNFEMKEGPSKGESNYEEAVEFDPIVHHNQYCPWVNGNVAAVGCASSAPSTSGDAIALCGWQLTLDASDALRSLGNNVIPMVQSESAASLYKNDQKAPSEKLLRNHSMSRSHGQL